MSTEKKPSLSRYGHEVLTADGFKLPVGTKAERWSQPKIGFNRYNSDSGRVEHYGSKGWESQRNELIYTSIKTADFAAEKNRAYPISTSGSIITVQTPPNPQPGDRFAIVDASSSWNVRHVNVTGTGGEKVERLSSRRFDVQNDHAVIVYTGIPNLGWVRENGGYPLVPVYEAIALKADQTYVDDMHNTTTHDDVSAAVDTPESLIEFDERTQGFKVLLHITKSDGSTELIDVQATKDATNNIAHTVSSEVRTKTASDVVVTVDYNAGMRLRIESVLAATIRMKVLWNVRVIPS